MNAILSIKPEFVEKIFSGEKLFEYRKTIFKQDVKKVYIYASSPICCIVGDFEIEEIITDTPDNLWSETKCYSGIKESFFRAYFKNRMIAYALKITKLRKYECYINPKERISGFVAPQSFRYISETQIDEYKI